MNESLTDLDKLERDAFRRYYEDGIFDIYLGLMLLAFFASAALWEFVEDEGASYVVMIGAALALTVPLLVFRRRLLRERLGTFKPGPRRRVRVTRTRWVLLGSLILGLAVFVAAAVTVAGAATEDLMAVVVPLLWFGNMVVVFGAMAYLLDVPRFYIYGLLGGLIMPLMIWPEAMWGIELPAWLLFGSAGVALIGFGLLKLRRFLQRYPAPQAR